MSIYTLRKNGFKVRVTHIRNTTEYPSMNGVKQVINPKGGCTTVDLRVGDKEYTDFAHCVDSDNFNKKLGATIAFGRIIKQIKQEDPQLAQQILTLFKAND